MLFKYTATLAVDSYGDATVYLGDEITGRVHAIKYTPGTLDTNGDLAITGETTGVPILTKADAGTAATWFYPRAMANKNTDGAAETFSSEDIHVFKERIKIIVAQGGNATTGSIDVFVDE